MQYDNPARRLYEVLTDAVNAATDEGRQPSTAATNTVWNVVFGEGNNRERLSDLNQLHYLLYLTRQSILRLQRVANKDIYFKPLEEVSRILYQHSLIGSKWISLHNELTKPMLLEMIAAAADAIDNEAHLFLLSEEQQKDILQSAEQLLKEIIESDIEQPLKTFLTVRLEEGCAAIRHYSMNGSEGLRRVIEANIGGAILQSAGFAKSDNGQTLLEKFMQLMFKCTTLLGIAADVDGFLLPTVTEVAKKLLPGGE